VPAGQTRTVAAQYEGNRNFLASSASTARRDPTIAATVTSAHAKTRYGWYRSPVVVRFTCTPQGAPLTVPCPAAVRLTNNVAAKSVSRTIHATDGGTATVAVTGLSIDRTAPRVRITGISNTAPYFSAVPSGRCVSHDRLSGIASCTIAHRQHGGTVTYTARTRDMAGNVSRVQRTVQVSMFVLADAPYDFGSYTVRAGHTYTMLAVATNRPNYVDATPYPGAPRGEDNAFYKTGHHRWALGVTFSTAMLAHPYWNIGIRADGTVHVLKVRVIR
jgi:hypothetical protein